MTVTSLPWRQAINAVRGGRNIASPNYGFQRQLLSFQHDSLPQEKLRLSSQFGPSPFDDEAECRILIKVHEQWVYHGDEGKGRNQTDSRDCDLYPLPHKAYMEHDPEARLAQVRRRDTDSDRAFVSQLKHDIREAADARKAGKQTASLTGTEQTESDQGPETEADPNPDSCPGRDHARVEKQSEVTNKVTDAACSSSKKSLIDELFECIDSPKPRGNVIIYTPRTNTERSHDSDSVRDMATTVYVCDGDSLKPSYTQQNVRCPHGQQGSLTSSQTDVAKDTPPRTDISTTRSGNTESVTVDDIFQSSQMIKR